MGQDFSPGRDGRLDDSVPPLEIPNFELIRAVGGGGYGQVWLAQSFLGEYRAIKVVRRVRFQDDRPYQREFEGIRLFEPVSRRHPGLVDVLYAGEGKGFFYYIMELADDARAECAASADEGGPREPQTRGMQTALQSQERRIQPATYVPKTLRWLLREQTTTLPAQDCLGIAIALTDTLVYLHQTGLVHRDIKPSNVIFVHGQAKLADIGLVADADGECSFVGTEGYVAPEGPGKPQADIYALGMLLYEMVTGLPPGDYPKIPDAWADSPERDRFNELNQVVLKACEPDVKRRYQSAEELRSELELLKNEKSLLRLRRLERFTRVLLLALGAALVAMGWFLYAIQVAKTRAAEQESRANEEGILRGVTQSQFAGPLAGWVARSWVHLRDSVKPGEPQHNFKQAVALLAGEDAQPIRVFRPLSGFAAAFGPDGQSVISGAGTNRALLLERDGTRHDLPIFGQGPVCWPPGEVALQFAAVSNRLVLREAETGFIRREFQIPGRGDFAASDVVLALAPDGRYVAAAWPGSLAAWETKTGTILAEREGTPTAIVFSPDGERLAAGDATGEARVYSMPTLTEIVTLPRLHPGSTILSAAFGEDRWVPDETGAPRSKWLLATADAGSNVIIWDLNRKLPRSVCRGSTWLVAALAFHPDGVTLASAGRNEARWWDAVTGKPLLRIPDQSAGVSTALAFDREGRRLLCAGEAGAAAPTVGLWSIERHRGIHTLRGLAAPVRKVWFSKDSQRLAALADSRHLGVWDVPEDRLLFCFEAPVEDLADQAGGGFDESGAHFALTSGNQARLYDLQHGCILQRWRLPEGRANQMQRDKLGRWLLLRRDKERERYVWRLRQLHLDGTATMLLEQTETDWSAYDLALAPGGERFLVWNSPNPALGIRVTIRGYAVAEGKELWRYRPPTNQPEVRIAFDPNGRWFGIEAVDPAHTLSLVRLSDFREVRKIPRTPHADYDAIAPSGKEFGGNGWYFPDATGLENGVRFVGNDFALAWVSAFSPDGRLLAQGTENGLVLVLDVRQTMERLAQWEQSGGAKPGAPAIF